MNKDHLVEVAGWIVARNVPTAVREVALSRLEDKKALRLHFFSDRVLSEDEVEMCELALAELCADLGDSVQQAESEYSKGHSAGTQLWDAWVFYTRRDEALQPTAADFLATCEGKWRPAAPAAPGVVETMVRDSGLSLPSDYVEFLALCNGGDGFLAAFPGYLRVWRAEDVVDNNRDYQMDENVRGFFGFGDAGGGEFFAFDTRGPQPWPVVSIQFVPMEVSSACAVSGSFTALLQHIAPPEAQDAEPGAAADGEDR